MADVYDVASQTEHTVTIKRVGIHLFGSATVVLQRTQIASVGQKLGRITVATADGRTFKVNPGIRQAQKDLVRAAFGL